MIDSAGLEAILNRLETGKRLSKQDLQILVTAVRSQQVTIATGDRAVAIGGSADGAIIVTGDRNFVITGANAEAIRELMGTRPRTERLLLQAVKEEITSRLKQSLHNQVLIQLAMEAQPKQVKRPWDSDIKIGDKPAEPISDDWSILRVFDEVQGKLLILGAPGAGKTTVMLDLAEALAKRAEYVFDYPIPVLFNLSAWTDENQAISEWLVDEMKWKYGVRKDIGEKWIKQAEILPLLDGLDELKPEQQEKCISEINNFIQSDNRPRYLIICSRREEYELWDTKLVLSGAINLRNLRDEQVEKYLKEANRLSLWNGIRRNSELLEIARIPLFVSIMTLAYEEISIKELQKVYLTSQGITDYLFAAYTRRMLKREARILSYKNNEPNQDKTKHWLKWIANNLQNESQTEFLIEQLQPIKLVSNAQGLYLLIISIFYYVPCLVYTISLGYSALFDKNYLLFTIFLFTQFFYFDGCLYIASNFHKDINPVESLRWSWNSARGSALAGTKIGFFIVFGTVCVIIVGITVFNLYENRSLPVSQIQFVSLYGGCLSIILSLILGAIYGFVCGMIGPEIQTKKKPNQGIYQSATNAIILGFGSWSIVVIACTLVGSFWGLIGLHNSTLISGFMWGTITGAILGIPSGLLLGFFGVSSGFMGTPLSGSPGKACLQHFILRFVIWIFGYAPWNYARFLNYSTERLLLQRVGGRYRFIHRLLQEHFAAMPLEKE